MTLGERAEATIGKLVMENMNLGVKLEVLQKQLDDYKAKDNVDEKPTTSKPSLKPVP